ncbi:ABC-ATPase domain-containing protein [Corynebacterium jeikeium]|uniref:ABC-ATPase domain-containing protein n=1 Tax=Corynebacterium jeikeium TaxID=38289 RepID=UPI0008832885|nr:ABC-ATPase domain-containing protein [Corynebacterium jeikeium]SCX13246.1 putative ATPase of the ABC class [Corynebacterium jeikeium]
MARNTLSHLFSRTKSLDGAGYGAYKKLKGAYSEPDLTVSIDRVQADPYASPSKLRLILPMKAAGIPQHLVDDATGRVAVADFLARRIQADPHRPRNVHIGDIGQQVLERTHVLVTPDRVEARLLVGLPAKGRRILGRQAAHLLADDLPNLSDDCLRHDRFDPADVQALEDHVALLRDQDALRAQLKSRKLVAFVGNGTILPRAAGDSDRPLAANRATSFESPESLSQTFELPSGRTVTGMGIPEGLTVIVGGGYHGKSTLLRALERGIYPHISGDGREWVISRADVASVRAEDGRPITGDDISPFITNLPTGTDTSHFSTTNASGSTSQAANVVEAHAAGACALLIDEDTSATNFMIRDHLMQRLVPNNKEPITPFVQRVRSLYDATSVSTVLIAGGSGAYLRLADTVIAMDAYRPSEVTARAHDIAREGEAPEKTEEAEDTGEFRHATARRILARGTLSSRKPPKPRGLSTISVDRSDIDLSAVGQLVAPSQTAAIAAALAWLSKNADGQTPLVDLVARLEQQITEKGLAVLTPGRDHPGHLSRPRGAEILAAANRYRELKLA